MALEVYRRKRDFRITPEPAGRLAKKKSQQLSFAIQKHAASHLHYDFRLELNGVLLSWAVPKGPSLDPNDKRLAMHVEDHPLEYGGFEGIIPPKQYGAGTVLLWDRGVWIPREDPVAGYRQGKLKFDLDGEKLQGGWTLVRSRGGKYGGDKAWLLIKEDDEFARTGPAARVVEDKPKSVATGRTIEQIAAERDREWHSNRSAADNVKRGTARKSAARPKTPKIEGGTRAPMPAFIEPQLATLVKQMPNGDDWIAEMKYDGYRMLCRIEKGTARMFSRNAKDWTANFDTIARAAARLPVDNAWLDGEVVVMEPDGRSSFQALQNALSIADKSRLFYYLFDLPYLNGCDLRRAPLVERKRALQALLDSPPEVIRFSAHLEGRGEEVFRAACDLKLEGVIAKLAASPYLPGRNRNWVKVKCAQRQEMVIGGFTDPEGARTGLGALLLGVYETDGTLRYSGKVGTGFNMASLASLRKRLNALEQKTPAFSNPPRGAEARRAHWVKPELVAEVAFTEWTDDGTLRHPSFQGLREDKKASEVVRERPTPNGAPAPDAGAPPAAPAAAPRTTKSAARSASKDVVAGVQLSNPDKVLFPEEGLTKRDLARYYEAIGEWIVPQLAQRPLSLVRCPNGWQKQCFYQKNADPSVDRAIDRVQVQTNDGPATYMMANSVAAVVALLQMGVLEIHPWGATAGRLAFPDRIVFDFDPDDDLPWQAVVEAVRIIRTLLDEIGLRGFLKTTGGKGLHVVVPIEPTLRWSAVKGFSKAIAELFASTFPDRFTAKISKATRHGKIFIDYLRNDEGSTAISAYSIRARAHAPVATPVAWEELAKDIRFDHFNVRNVPARLKRLKRDPWADLLTVRQSVTKATMKRVGYAAPGD